MLPVFCEIIKGKRSIIDLIVLMFKRVLGINAANYWLKWNKIKYELNIVRIKENKLI